MFDSIGFFAKSSVQCASMANIASDGTTSCMSCTGTLTCAGESTPSGCVGWGISPVWRTKLQLVKFLMRGLAVSGGEDDHAYVGWTKSAMS